MANEYYNLLNKFRIMSKISKTIVNFLYNYQPNIEFIFLSEDFRNNFLIA